MQGNWVVKSVGLLAICGGASLGLLALAVDGTSDATSAVGAAATAPGAMNAAPPAAELGAAGARAGDAALYKCMKSDRMTTAKTKSACAKTGGSWKLIDSNDATTSHSGAAGATGAAGTPDQSGTSGINGAGAPPQGSTGAVEPGKTNVTPSP